MIRKFFFSSNRAMVVAGILALTVLFTACKKNDSDVIQQPVAGSMAFNLVPDLPAVAITLSGNLIPGGELPYTSYSGRYLNVYPGNRIIGSYNAQTSARLDSLGYDFDQNVEQLIPLASVMAQAAVEWSTDWIAFFLDAPGKSSATRSRPPGR